MNIYNRSNGIKPINLKIYIVQRVRKAKHLTNEAMIEAMIEK